MMQQQQQRGRGSRGRAGRGRAGYAGRMRGSRNTNWRKPDAQETPAPPLGSLLAKVHENDLTDVSNADETSARISNCKLVASFNWLNEKEPTILIPGKPPAWTPLSQPSKLNEDAGEYFRDQNSARYPSHPMEPAVEAILTQNPEFPTESIDIVGCGSTIGNLLRFSRRVDREFRMLVEVVGSTVFFVRREKSPREIIQNVYGFGHSFPEAYTTWPSSVKGSESHQRLIQYTFGGMNCVVRFEADGYLHDIAPKQSQNSPQSTSANRKVDPDQELASILDDTTLGRRDTESTPGSKPLTIQSAGDHVPQDAIFDLKTRSIRKKDNDVLGEELPRLWVSQIPNFVLAFHKAGVFDMEEIKVQNVRESLGRWEKEENHNLRQLVVLLKLLVAFARTRPDGRFELVHEEGKKTLDLREVCEDVPRTLPPILNEKWGMENSDYGDDDQLASLGPGDQDGHTDLDWDSESEKDYTACDAECGYCGSCRY